MEFKDYYKILGVEKNAAPDQIKKAFRKLAVKYHPDKNPGDKAAEEKFKEISEANEILGDPQKRKKYDEMGSNWKQYEQMHRQQQQPGRGGRTVYETQDSSDFHDFFESIFGGGFTDMFGGTRYGGQRGSAKGQNLEGSISISLDEAWHGTTRRIVVHGETYQIKIHRGIKDGEVLRLRGKGGKGEGGGQAGDLLIKTHIINHQLFERRDNDLYCDQSVDLYTLILGGKVTVTTFKGKISMDIKPGTQNGQVLRLKGMGMPADKQAQSFGDLYLKVHVTLPKNLSDDELRLFRQLAKK